MTSCIAIVTDDPGWHGERLREAFCARGCATVFVSLRDCRIDLTYGAHGLVIPGFEDRLPDGVFVRGVPGGTLEEVVFYLDVLHALRELGVPVYNDVRTIERSVDKGMTSFLLQRAGISTPPTWVTTDFATARAILMRESANGYELVLKPLFGSCGKGIMRLGLGASLPDSFECHGVYYLQRFVAAERAPWKDLRLFVVGGQVCAAMRREGQDWVTNVARGARCHPQEASDTQAALAQDATRALNMDYAGVDLIRDSDGQDVVIEVNAIPSWKGLQGVCAINIAQCLVDDFLTRYVPRERLDIAT